MPGCLLLDGSPHPVGPALTQIPHRATAQLGSTPLPIQIQTPLLLAKPRRTTPASRQTVHIVNRKATSGKTYFFLIFSSTRCPVANRIIGDKVLPAENPARIDTLVAGFWVDLVARIGF